MRVFTLFVCASLASCGSNPVSGPLPCDPNGNCPVGLHCFHALCYVDGTIDLAGFSLDGGGGGDGPQSSCSGLDAKQLANSYTLPRQKSDYALDLNGDGKLDNQYGNINGALLAQNLDAQPGVTSAISSGQLVLLFDQTGATLQNDTCASVVFTLGRATAQPPAFDGSDVLSADPAIAPGTFTGTVTAGAFSSTPPATNPIDVVVTLPIPFALAGATPTLMPIHGAHLSFARAGNNPVKGQINGAIKNSDVQTTMIPNVAALLNQQIAANPGSSSSQQMLAIFDTGGNDSSPPSGCTNIDGTPSCKNATGPDQGQCASKGDRIISTCEVATNSIIKNVLAPDVQMFAADGVTYQPSAANTNKDSLSVGVAFTAVRASF